MGEKLPLVIKKPKTNKKKTHTNQLLQKKEPIRYKSRSRRRNKYSKSLPSPPLRPCKQIRCNTHTEGEKKPIMPSCFL